MKNLWIALVLLSQCFSTASYAQGEYVVEIDTTTGMVHKIGTDPIPGIHWVSGIRTYDEVNGQLIFSGGLIDPDHLYFVDVYNGDRVTSPVFPATEGLSSVREPQYDNSTGKLYGLHWDTSATAFFLSTIDRVTGLHTHVGTTPITVLFGTSQGRTTFDQNHHRYIHLLGKQLACIDAGSGALLSNSLLTLPQGDNIISMVYDQATDKLYGLRQHNDTPARYIATTIDVATGVVTNIGEGTHLGIGNGWGTIDTVSHRYIYEYINGEGFYVAALDLYSGELVFHHKLVLDSGENVINLFFDNTRRKLFAIHWNYSDSASNVLHNRLDCSLKIFPVPAKAKLYVQFDKYFPTVAFNFYSMNHQLVKRIGGRTAQRINVIEVGDMAPGAYILEVITEGGSCIRKIIVD